MIRLEVTNCLKAISRPCQLYSNTCRRLSRGSHSRPEAMKDLIAIIGTTGVGKTQLSVDVALSIKANHQNSDVTSNRAKPAGGEIVNSDSMQVYKGLDVITNKATQAERSLVPHHLIDFLDAGEDYRVDKFIEDAVPVIELSHQKGMLPIVVGGTMYFMQNLLFPGQLIVGQANNAPVVKTNPKCLEDLSPELRYKAAQLSPELLKLIFVIQDLPAISTAASFPPGFPVESLPSDFQTSEELSIGLYRILQVLDPSMSEKWHWRDIRKIRRSVEIALQTGRTQTDIISEQRNNTKDAHLVRYRTLIFWLYADPAQLDDRLDTRIDNMIKHGLLDEVMEMRNIARQNEHTDVSKGVYQSIGYKEFADYFDAVEAEPRAYESHEELFGKGVESMKLGTRQYSRRQIKWIRNKLIPEVHKASKMAADKGEPSSIYLYLLDASDISRWDENVKGPALDILERFVSKSAMPKAEDINSFAASLLQLKASLPEAHNKRKITCEICTVDVSRPFLVEKGAEWEVHKNTRSHRKRLQKQNQKPWPTRRKSNEEE